MQHPNYKIIPHELQVSEAFFKKCVKQEEGLKEMFIKSLTDLDSDIDSTGNMGLIEMVKKSGSKLAYLFEEINEEYSYYTLTVSIIENLNS